jgi:hypothetical protein
LNEKVLIRFLPKSREGEGTIAQLHCPPRFRRFGNDVREVFIKDLSNEKVLLLFLSKSGGGAIAPLSFRFRRLCVVAFATHLSTRAFVVAKS